MSHDFADCAPPDWTHASNPVLAEAMVSAARTVWAIISEAERMGFHRANCCNSEDPDDLAAAIAYRDKVFTQMQTDRRRYAKHAAQVLDFAEKIDLQVVEPSPGEVVTLVVFRVADEMALGTDVPPASRLRRGIVHCDRCREKCWLDPISHGKAIPVPVCVRCFDPRVGQALDEASAKRKSARS